MKKIFKLVFSLALAAALLMGLGVSALAESSVNYLGGAERFVFLPGGSTGGDLFEGFKNVMPGDEITQQIKIKNSFFGPSVVRIYMRAVPHDPQLNPLSPETAAKEDYATMADFLSQLYMEVWHGDRCLFSASPDELGGLVNNVPLGSFYRFTGTTLNVKLKVPIELGNEYANRIGEVDWIFTAEEIPYSAGPRTGDDNNIALVASLMLGSLSLCVILFLILRRKKAKAE